MGLAPTAGRPPAIPHVQEPPPGLTRARWLYVDEALSHEVHAGIRPGAPEAFVAREAAYGSGDPGEMIETVLPIQETWDAHLFHRELETRLGLLGRYWKHDARRPGWTRLPSAPATLSVDLREVDVQLFPGDANFYHFHTRGSPDVVVVRLPLFQPNGLRYLLARATLEFPDAVRGDIQLVHARLPLTPMRSVLIAQHRDLATRGYAKVVRPQDFAGVHGPTWQGGLLECYRGILDRIGRGQFGTLAHGDHEKPIDEVYTDYVKWLNDPRVGALHARFLSPDEEARIMSGGEEFIKQAIARKRAHAPPEDQILLVVLEASLLARDGLRHGNHKVDPEVAALVRRFAYYL